VILGYLFGDVSHILLDLTYNHIASPALLQFNYQDFLLVLADGKNIY